ncbi:MAG: hypothetical protein AAF532_13980 [Planctomycetota bacterium]
MAFTEAGGVTASALAIAALPLLAQVPEGDAGFAAAALEACVNAGPFAVFAFWQSCVVQPKREKERDDSMQRYLTDLAERHEAEIARLQESHERQLQLLVGRENS